MMNVELNISNLIKKVLPLVYPDDKITQEALGVVEQMLSYVYQQIKHITPDTRNVNEILSNLISGELVKHAMSEYRKSPKPDSIIEYLAAEILELSGNKAHDNKLNTINTFELYGAIMKDKELYTSFHKFIPIFPYLDVKLDQNKKLLLKKNKQKIPEYSVTKGYKKGLYNLLSCLVKVYSGFESQLLVQYADAIAQKGNRIRDPSFDGIESFQFEIMLAIYAYSKLLQPNGPLKFDTLLRASLLNPYLEGLVNMPDTFLQCIPKV